MSKTRTLFALRSPGVGAAYLLEDTIDDGDQRRQRRRFKVVSEPLDRTVLHLMDQVLAELGELGRALGAGGARIGGDGFAERIYEPEQHQLQHLGIAGKLNRLRVILAHAAVSFARAILPRPAAQRETAP